MVLSSACHRQNNGPPRISTYQFSAPANVLHYMEKRDFADVTKLRILTWEGYWGGGGWGSEITRVPIRERHEGPSQREKI